MEVARLGRNLQRLRGDLSALGRSLPPTEFARYCGALIKAAPSVILSKGLVVVDRKMIGRNYTFNVAGVQVIVRGEDFSGAREMYARAVYFAEPDVQLPRRGLAVDLGANRGLFTLVAAASGMNVAAVEAQSGFAKEIEEQLRLNGISEGRVRILSGIVGSSTGVFAGEDAWRYGSHAGSAPPPPLTFAEILAGYEEISFLKMDIEGSEFALFEDPQFDLGRIRRIAMEVHPRFGRVERLVELLANAGFATAIRSADLERCNIDDIGRDGCGYLYAWRSG